MTLTINLPSAPDTDPRIGTAEVSQPEKPLEKFDLSKINPGQDVYYTPPIATFQIDMARVSVGELGKLSKYRDKITQLHIRWLTWDNLDFVRHFPNIRTAGIDARVKDISALQSLRQLKYLTLIVTPAPLDILGSLASVETISISREWRPGSESIFSLPQVVQAGLGTLPYSNLERMGGWTDLKELFLRWGKVEELTGIPESVEIVELHVLRKLSSLRGLSACSQLRKLIVQECRGVCSLEGLQHCRRLKQIGMAITGPIEDLEPLRPLRELEYVFIADRTIVGSVQNVDALYNQPNLRTLIIPRKSGLDPNQVLRIAPRCDVRLTKG